MIAQDKQVKPNWNKDILQQPLNLFQLLHAELLVLLQSNSKNLTIVSQQATKQTLALPMSRNTDERN